MFTGLIEEVGKIESIRKVAGGARLRVAAREVLQGTRAGDSIAVDGACLTVEAFSPTFFTAVLSSETLAATTFASARAGAAVNLERALAFGGRLGGHLVSGHVEAVGKVVALTPRGEGGAALVLSVPPSFLSWVLVKGSVAVDGVSLTVAELSDSGFSAAIIPETLARTTLRLKRGGDSVNLEPDLLLKYVKSLLENRFSGGGDLPVADRLRKAGFRVD
jgi:riboflavin synthase